MEIYQNKIVALAISDIHINDWPPLIYNNYEYPQDRLYQSLRVLDLISNNAHNLDVPILFAGDLFHKPKNLPNKVINEFINYYRLYLEDRGVKFIAISGNHDQDSQNFLDRGNRANSYINAFSKVFKTLICIDESSYTNKNFIVCGIPYLTYNSGFKRCLERLKQVVSQENKLKILLIHTDLPGAKGIYGNEIGEHRNIPDNLNEFFKPFDLVLDGHIHLPQKITKNIQILGAPYQQNSGEMGIKMGYWEVYLDGSLKFKNLDLPQYKYWDFKKGLPTDKYHIYIPKKDSLKIKHEEENNNSQFDISKSRKSIAKNYLKKKGIKSKMKKRALIGILKKS